MRLSDKRFFKSQQIMRGDDKQNHLLDIFGYEGEKAIFDVARWRGKLWTRHNNGIWQEYSTIGPFASYYAAIVLKFDLER